MRSDFEVEPVPGLPEVLPEGERVLWQGRPRWQGLLAEAFQARWVAAYFCLLAAVRAGLALHEGQGGAAALLSVLSTGLLGAVCLGILALLAYFYARSTIYTLTTRRVVMRFGVALPMAFNLPFRRLAAADLLLREGGEGDIALTLMGKDRIAWLHLWPHARPWRLARAQPMLRAIPEAARVAALLGDAVGGTQAAGQEARR